MFRVYAPDLKPDPITLATEEGRHLIRVRRARDGDEVCAMDGRGGIAHATLRIDGKKALLHVHKREQQPRIGREVHLVQALPKGAKLDLILQKATELGVHSIYPVATEQGDVKLIPGRTGKLERGQQVLIEAMKQSGNPWLPILHEPTRLLDQLKDLPTLDHWLIAAALPEAKEVNSIALKESVGVLIGPEGDFSPAELEAVSDFGATTISLGPYVLRSETAAIHAIGLLRYL